MGSRAEVIVRTRACALNPGLVLVALVSVLCAPGAAAAADERDDAARAAVYDFLSGGAFTVNRAAPRMYCLVLIANPDGSAKAVDPTPAAMPAGRYDAPVEPGSRCTEGGLVFYTSAVRWDDGRAAVVGGVWALFTQHPTVRQPARDRRTFRVERAGDQWVVTGSELEPVAETVRGPGMTEPSAAATLRYWALVDRYGRGDRQAATEDLARLGDGDIRRALTEAPRRPAARAVLLHTALAFSGPDGTLSPTYGRHLGFARALLEGPGMEGPAGRSFARRWYLAATRKAHEIADGSLGRRLASAGLRAFPEDPALSMAWGRLEETIAWHGPVWHVVPGSRGLSEAETWGARPPPLPRTQEVEAALREAARLFASALRVREDDPEARLRLGRVQLEMRALDRAEANLGQVLAGHPPPECAYLAWIFLGRIAEKRGNPSLAAEAYRSAGKEVPGAQTAIIALSQVLFRQGKSEEARETLRESVAGSRVADPFRTYVLAGAPTADEEFETLRQETSS